jgi:hypothetical protein
MFQQEARIHFGKADSIKDLSSQPNIPVQFSRIAARRLSI